MFLLGTGKFHDIPPYPNPKGSLEIRGSPGPATGKIVAVNPELRQHLLSKM